MEQTCTVGGELPDLTGDDTFLASVRYDFSNETGENSSVSSNAKARLTASICLPLLTNTSITPANAMKSVSLTEYYY